MKKKMMTTENFVKKAKRIHGTRYDYSKVVYAGALDEVKIRCFDHGDYEQTPVRHLWGGGCPKCPQ